MADTKITALTAISTNPVNPATFPIPMVDLLDTSMAASGTTKKVTVNQILGAGGTATLASATITGDLTVDTTTLVVNASTDRVGIGTTNTFKPLTVQAGSTGAAAINQGLVINSSAAYGVGQGVSYSSLVFSRNRSIDTSSLNASAEIFGGNSVETSSDGGFLGFRTQNAAGALTDRYTIDNTGISTWSVAGTTAMTLNSTGLAIGVTPNTWTSYKALQVNSASIWSTTANDTAYASNVYYDGAYKFRSASSDKACMYIQFGGSHQWHYTAAAGTAGNTAAFTQAMTLDASGRLLLGKAASALGTVGIESAAGGFIQSTVTSDASLFCNRLATDGETIKFYRQTLQVGNISVTTTATAYNTSSDYRLKEDAQPLVGGLARVNALKPSIYKWKVNGSTGEGFMAHELADVVPLAVTGDKDAVDADGKPAYQGVDLSKLVPILVAAIQELTARVQTLEAR